MSWYYAVEQRQLGPVEDTAFSQLIADGVVTARTLVWRAGMDAWLPFEQVRASESGERATCASCKRTGPAELTVPINGSPVCVDCKQRVMQRLREGQAPFAANVRYGGFWIRFVARMIDNMITSVVGYIFQIPLLVLAVASNPAKDGPPEVGYFIGAMAFAVLMSMLTAGYYEAWFTMKKGATPGKLILGLRVVRARGSDMTWRIAWGRFLAYLFSSFTLYVGYLMAAWDEEKRALHDRICDTRVVVGK